MEFTGTTIEDRQKEIKAIFNDPDLLHCMDSGLSNTGLPIDAATRELRGQKAVEAFSKNPPEFWDMSANYQG